LEFCKPEKCFLNQIILFLFSSSKKLLFLFYFLHIFSSLKHIEEEKRWWEGWKLLNCPVSTSNETRIGILVCAELGSTEITELNLSYI